MLGRMGNVLNREALYATVGPTSGPGKASIVTAGSTLNWQNNEWHLLVINWSSNWIELSVDGELGRRLGLPQELKSTAINRIFISSSEQFGIDEVLMFNEPLSPQEIDWLMKSKGNGSVPSNSTNTNSTNTNSTNTNSTNSATPSKAPPNGQTPSP